MTKKSQHKIKRISITITEEEYEQWKKADSMQNLSSFIREAVNEYVKIQEPSKKTSLSDLYLEHQIALMDIQKKLGKLEKIEGELVDIGAALAKFDLLEYDQTNETWEPKKKPRIDGK
jgi:hypothetical protein